MMQMIANVFRVQSSEVRSPGPGRQIDRIDVVLGLQQRGCLMHASARNGCSKHSKPKVKRGVQDSEPLLLFFDSTSSWNLYLVQGDFNMSQHRPLQWNLWKVSSRASCRSRKVAKRPFSVALVLVIRSSHTSSAKFA